MEESMRVIKDCLSDDQFWAYCYGRAMESLFNDDAKTAYTFLGYALGKIDYDEPEKPSEVKNEPSEPIECDKMEEGISLTKSENHSKAEELAGDYFVRHGKAPVKKGKGRPAKFDWSKASNLYAQGYDLPDIAKIIGCEESTIWNRKSRHPEEFVRRSE